MTPYEIVKNAVVAVVPEIMALEAGLVVTLPDKSPLRVLHVDHVNHLTGIFPCTVHYLETCSRIESGSLCTQDGLTIRLEDWQDSLPVERMGREIRLSDVMRAIERSDFVTPIYVAMSGCFYHKFENGDLSAPLACWNLYFDDLSKQSPECLKFLAGLVGKE